jgi:hypothetical protein
MRQFQITGLGNRQQGSSDGQQSQGSPDHNGWASDRGARRGLGGIDLAHKALRGTMDHHTRVEPWLTLPIPLGNVIQIGGLLGGVLLARRAAKLGRRGAGWLYAGRLLAYFCEHAFSHYVVGRLGGIRFAGYGLHRSTHTHLYPPGMGWVFAHLPFLSARIDLASRRATVPAAQAVMYIAGPLVTVLASILFPLYGLIHGIPRARALLIGSSLWMAGMLVGELVHGQGDLRRAWRVLRHTS